MPFIGRGHGLGMDDLHPRATTFPGDDDGRVGGGVIAWILGSIAIEFVIALAIVSRLL